MDIKGIGIDIVSTKRIKNKLYLVDKFLTEEELKYFNSLEDLNGKIEFASGRWAAKEAIIKAYDKNVTPLMITILKRENGHPYVLLNNIEANYINISISHEKEYAIAFSVVLKV